MTVFDNYIDEIKDFVRSLKEKGIQTTEFDCQLDDAEEIKKGLPVKVGDHAHTGIILRNNTFVELGNPLKGSSSAFLWTDNPAAIQKGKITVIGPDFPKEAGESMALGQIFIAAGSDLGIHDLQKMTMSLHVADQIEGFMAKSSPDHDVWCRVNTKSAEKGFNFETMGKALMAIFKTHIPEAEAMEVIFITSGKEDVKQFHEISMKIKKFSKEIVKGYWKEKGYELDCDFDCDSCGDQDVCDDIRDILASRKKKK